MIDGDVLTNLERIATALERLAEHFSPCEAPRERKPAILSKAIYSREEREREDLRKRLKGGTSKPQAEDL